MKCFLNPRPQESAPGVPVEKWYRVAVDDCSVDERRQSVHVYAKRNT